MLVDFTSSVVLFVASIQKILRLFSLLSSCRRGAWDGRNIGQSDPSGTFCADLKKKQKTLRAFRSFEIRDEVAVSLGGEFGMSGAKAPSTPEP